MEINLNNLKLRARKLTEERPGEVAVVTVAITAYLMHKRVVKKSSAAAVAKALNKLPEHVMELKEMFDQVPDMTFVGTGSQFLSVMHPTGAMVTFFADFAKASDADIMKLADTARGFATVKP